MRIQGLDRNEIRRWRSRGRTIVRLFALMAVAPLAGGGQSIPLQTVGVRNFDALAAATSAISARVHILREIRDQYTGVCWRLLPNPTSPAGPAQMVAVTSSEKSCARAQADPVPQQLAIHPGDRVVVEEHTPTAEVCLEAVALGPAMAGSTLDLRLKIGGKVVRAMAIAPGRAALLPATEGKR